MAEFNHRAIRVNLVKTGYTILMTVRRDSDERMVVFADPEKLRPYMDAINSKEDPNYLKGKHAQAREGLLAARQIVDDPDPVPGPDENPLPMASVSCWLSGGKPNIGISDGVTRTTELILQGAEFVPLEVSVKEADLLHRTVGGQLPPKPTDDYIVPSDIRIERMIAYSERLRTRTECKS